MKKQSAGRRVRGEKIRRKKMQVREKVGKLRFTVFFRGFVAPEGRKVGSLKRRVRRHFLELRCRKSARRCGAKHILKSKCTKHTMLGPLLEVDFRKSARRCGAKHISKSKCTKHTRVRTTFGSWVVETVYAVVARSTFRSQNVQNTPCSDHFSKLRCRKTARRCGAKHISKSKCTKHTRVRTTFGSWVCEKVHAVVARSTFPSEHAQGTPCSDHFWMLRCLHYTTLHYTTLHYRVKLDS